MGEANPNTPTNPLYGEPRFALPSARAGEVICCNASSADKPATRLSAKKKCFNGEASEHAASDFVTYDEALGICEEAGMTLCSTQEDIDTTCDEGCGLSTALVWTANSRPISARPMEPEEHDEDKDGKVDDADKDKKDNKKPDKKKEGKDGKEEKNKDNDKGGKDG